MPTDTPASEREAEAKAKPTIASAIRRSFFPLMIFASN